MEAGAVAGCRWWRGLGPVFISSHLLPSADSGSGAAPAAAAMPGPEVAARSYQQHSYTANKDGEDSWKMLLKFDL